MTQRGRVAAADRSSASQSGTPVALRTPEVVPMTPVEEERLYRLLGRLIAAALEPGARRVVARLGQEARARPVLETSGNGSDEPSQQLIQDRGTDGRPTA